MSTRKNSIWRTRISVHKNHGTIQLSNITIDKTGHWLTGHCMSYEDVENIRSKTQAMIQIWLKVYGDARDVIQGVESAGN